MTRSQTAVEYFKKGYACSQAVALAFCDLTNVNEADIAKLSLGFGGGMGRLRLTCGAVSGMVMMASLIFSNDSLDAKNKLDVYSIVRELCSQFERETGSLICGDLLSNAGVKKEVGGNPELRTETYYQKRPCVELVRLASQILEDYINKNN